MMEKHPLREYRRANGLSLEAMAEQVHSTAATISRIERRKQVPSLELVRRLKGTTGLSADAFLPEEVA